MENNKKNVLNNQPNNEENKKKNKLVAWWLGLGKWAKVGVCAGSAAVLATAITLPIVLTQNKGGTPVKPFSGEVTADQWKTALSASISFGDGTNFKCTIHNALDEEHDTTIKMVEKKVHLNEWSGSIYENKYEFEDDFGYWSQQISDNDGRYNYFTDASVLTHYDRLKYIYNNNNNFANFTFNSTTKEYNRISESENKGSFDLASIKFKDENHIEKATVIETISKDVYKTYTFEYGNITLDSFTNPSNIYSLEYNGQTANYSTNHTITQDNEPYYKVDVSKFSAFDPITNKLYCYHPNATGDAGIAQGTVYKDKVLIQGAGYSKDDFEFTGLDDANISANSKLVLTCTDEGSINATNGFKVEVVNR